MRAAGNRTALRDRHATRRPSLYPPAEEPPLTDPAALSRRALIALTLAVIFVAVAYRRDMLDRAGAGAAVLLGAALVATGGWWAGLLLCAFFASSSLLSPGRSDRRSWRQVLANGGPALAFAVIAVLTDDAAIGLGIAAAISAANADTWATEIGRRSGVTPRSLRTLKPVTAGTSGAVSVAGSLGTVAGAVLIATLAAVLAPIAAVDVPPAGILLPVVAGAGVFGSLLDSALGAFVQARYRCERCGGISEDPSDPAHRFRRVSGVAGLTNGAVNLVCTVAAGGLAVLLATATMEA